VSLKELEMQVQQLPKPELAKFSEWFDVFREANILTEGVAGDLEQAQQEEVLRRQAEYLANPSRASAWDDGFFDRLRQRLADARPQKAASH
jgi:putative addiction module component (TIGR02574 family)